MIQDNKYFKPWPFFATKLTGDLLYKDKFLDIPDEKGMTLCDKLGGDSYTYLTLGDGCDFEVIRVCPRQGKLYVEREIEGTRRKDWPCGTCIEFQWTVCSMQDLQYGSKPEEPEEFDIPCGFNGTLCIGKWDYTIKNGWIAGRECTNRNIPNFADNASICFDKDGCITEVVEGRNKVAQYIKR